jgi:sulfate transport system ATP-binding protein
MSISVENITRRFGSFRALNNVSLDFPSGELVALLGPSGCGKTTLLRIIAGLDFADEGRVLLEGHDASNTHVRERQVGFVFQHYALFRHMSVFENVAFGLRVKPKAERPSDAEINRKVHELLDLVQLDWLADRSPSQLSGGQRQRIALARALAVEPSVLLLDEPFGALDAKVRKELRRWLRRLHNDLHITSIFVTHDQEEALEVADRVVLMNKGEVVQQGTPQEVYDKPATAFVYGFLGSANRFTGTIGGGALRLGSSSMKVENGDAFEGREVVAFARPHDVSLMRAEETSQGLPVRISRILTLGPSARIELAGIADGAPYEVDLPRRALAEKRYFDGEELLLVADRLAVFDRQGDLPA